MTQKPPHWATSWRRPDQKKKTGVLTLSEVVILRRIRDGESQSETAKALGLNRGTVSTHLCSARERFGVPTTEELLALPRVLEQLGDGTGEQP